MLGPTLPGLGKAAIDREALDDGPDLLRRIGGDGIAARNDGQRGKPTSVTRMAWSTDSSSAWPAVRSQDPVESTQQLGRVLEAHQTIWASERQFSNMRSPIAVDLFAGCGGLSEGLKNAGFAVAGAVEIDPLAAKTYSLNHPEVRIWTNDIRDISALGLKRALRLRKGSLDLLAGCPPCQGFSTIRTLNGSRRVTDRRNSLIDEFLRFVEELRPRAIMFENVPGLDGRRRFVRFRARLQAEGYNTLHSVLDVADFGVPQRRRRLILIGALEFEPKFAKQSGRRRTVAGAISRLPHPDRSRDLLHKSPGTRTARINELLAAIPKDGGSRGCLPTNMQLECHNNFDGFSDVYGRMSWTEVSPTITGGCLNPSKGRFIHPEQNRAITAREAALLQSFSSGYRFCLDRGYYAVAEMIGNALPPEFIRRQAVQICEQLACLG